MRTEDTGQQRRGQWWSLAVKRTGERRNNCRMAEKDGLFLHKGRNLACLMW